MTSLSSAPAPRASIVQMRSQRGPAGCGRGARACRGPVTYWGCIPQRHCSVRARRWRVPRGRGQGGRRRRGSAGVARIDGLQLPDEGQVRWLASKTSTLSGARQTGRDRCSRGGRGEAYCQSRRLGLRLRGCHPTHPWPERTGGRLDEPGGYRPESVPRRLLVFGGGPVGVELAQAVHRLGAEAVIVEASPHLLSREPAPLGEALGDALRRDGVEVAVGMSVTSARREGEDFVLGFDGGRGGAATSFWWPPGGARAVTISAWSPSGSRPTGTASPSTPTFGPVSAYGRSVT